MKQNNAAIHAVKTRLFAAGVTLTLAAALLLTPLMSSGRAQEGGLQRTFKTPEAAVKELIAAARSRKSDALFAVVGPEMKGMTMTGDALLDEEDLSDFVRAAQNRVAIETDPEDPSRKVAYFGRLGWPFPAPLVKQGDSWRFDSAAGRAEIENRRLGGNEIDAILACRAYQKAQLEYAQEDHNGDGVLEFAQKLLSSEGKKDGLYWSQAENEPLSPLGYYFAIGEGERPTAYAGYRFKILIAQGANAVGGAQSFLANGRLLGGFALIAWPVEYGKTGVNTFLVYQAGTIYQKDLGVDTSSLAAAIIAFDPDNSWSLVTDDASDEDETD